MSKEDSWLIEFASFLEEKWIVQKPNLILGGSAIGLIYDVYTWILIWNCYRFTSAVHWWIYYKWICCEWWLLFYATAAVTADDETGNANSEPFESTTLLSPFFRGTSESSISFCLLVWNCRQNGVKILTWLGWVFLFSVPVYAFLFRHHFERTRLVNACSQYRFLPLGQDHFSPLLSLLFSLFFPSSRFWSRCCTCVWMNGYLFESESWF